MINHIQCLHIARTDDLCRREGAAMTEGVVLHLKFWLLRNDCGKLVYASLPKQCR